VGSFLAFEVGSMMLLLLPRLESLSIMKLHRLHVHHFPKKSVHLRKKCAFWTIFGPFSDEILRKMESYDTNQVPGVSYGASNYHTDCHPT